MKRERVTLITLGVQDLDRSRRFYADWGWQAHPASQPGLVLFQMTGAALALFQRGELAHDQGRPEAELGTGAMTLAQNCADDAEADAVFAAALAAGARRLGVKLFQNCAARGLETQGGSVSGVVTEKGTIRTSAVLLAGGAWELRDVRAA